LSFQEDTIGIRLRDVIGVDNMMWGSDYPHSESTFPQSRKILSEILEGVPEDEQAKPALDRDPGIAAGNTARVYKFDVAKLTEDQSNRSSDPGSAEGRSLVESAHP
jgi:Amidohydrolase